MCWSTIRTAAALATWQIAWGGGTPGPFRPQLLDDDAVLVVGGRREGGIVAGAVLKRSPRVVGISNVFAVDGDLDAAWSGILAVMAERWPGLPAVGYESGHELDVAVRAGFAPIGTLRIWLRP